MRRWFVVIIVACLALGCQQNTIEGMREGMPYAEVLERISRTDQVINTDDGAIVTEGMFSPTDQRARKTFLFENGKLVGVSYKMLGESEPR